MFGTLLKVYFSDTAARIFSAFKKGRNGNSRSTVSAVALLVLVAAAVIGVLFSFTQVLNEFAGLIFKSQQSWLFYLIVTILNFSLMVLGSVFLAKNLLFDSKDNNILLSLPIKPSILLLSRIIMLLIYNVVFELLFGIPAIISAIMNGAAAVEIVKFIIFGLFLPMFSASISAFFAWLLSLLMSHIKHKSLFTTIFSLAFFVLYFFFCGNISDIMLTLINNVDTISESVRGIAIIYWLGACIGESNFLYFALFCLAFLATIIVCYFILSFTFLKTITSNRGTAKIAYKEKPLKTSTPNGALLKREFKHLFSSSIYLLNSCLGVLFSLIFTGFIIYTIFDSGSTFNELIIILRNESGIENINNLIAGVGFIMVLFLTSTTCITAPSISIEAKNLWILKSLPTSMQNIINNKILVQLIITLPIAVVQAIALVILTKPTVLFGIMIVLGIILFNLFSAILGMTEGLRHPNLNWRTETQAVKSGFAVIFTMLILFGATVLAGLAYYAFSKVTIDPTIAIVCYNLVIALATSLLYFYVMKKGPAILDEI